MTVAFGFEKYDIPMLKNADLGVCFDNSPEEVKGVCGIIIKKNNPDKYSSYYLLRHIRMHPSESDKWRLFPAEWSLDL